VNARYNYQSGHAPSWHRPRFTRAYDVPPHASTREAHDHKAESLSVPTSALPEGRAGLLALLSVWDRLAGPIQEDWIRDGLRSLRLGRDALRKHLHFDERAYQPTRIHSREHYEVLVQCWRSGQGSPIQEHGGSTCGVLVVEGVATEVAFMATACGRLAPSRSQRVHAGAVVVSRARDVHQLANLEPPGVDLVSLHVYSPPLSGRRCYRLAETTFADHDDLVDNPPAIRSAPL
jgi:cysteine dioxygenase